MFLFRRKFTTVALAAAILMACCSLAWALPSSSRGMAAFSEKDPTYFYVGLSDAKRIAKDLGRSELVRLLVNLAPDYEFFREFLKDFPAEDFSLMLSDTGEYGVTFQMAIAFDEGKRAILDKVAARTAEEMDIAELFGGGALMLDVMGLYIPEYEDEHYELGTFDLYFASHENLLILGSSEEALERSIVACKNRFRRHGFDFRGSGDNVAFARIGEALTAEIFGPMAYPVGDEPVVNAGHVYFEGDFALVPGGWDMELYTNVIGSLYGDRLSQIAYAKKPGSFFGAGGGRLVVTVDSTPDLRQLLSGSYGPMARFWRNAGGIVEVVEEKLGRRKGEELGEAMMAIDRMNFAVTTAGDDLSDLRAYLFLSSREDGRTERIGEILSELIEGYNDSPEVEARFERIEIPGWSRAYSLPLPQEASVLSTQSAFTMAFGQEGLFAGLMSDALMEREFETTSALYGEISSAEDVIEVVYLDMRALRKIAGTIANTVGMRRQSRQLLGAVTIPFMDMREIGMQTHALDHFSMKFRTGWLDFDERDFIWSLFQ